jgi:hypothetical protein
MDGSARGDDDPCMSDRGMHAIEDDLAENWLDDWVGAGIAEIEDYLVKHARFIDYLEAHEAA